MTMTDIDEPKEQLTSAPSTIRTATADDPSPSQDLDSAQRRRRLPRPTKRHFLAGLGLAALIAGSAYGYDYWKWSAVHETTDDAFVDAHIVQVSPRIAGHVDRVYINDNQIVKAGDLLLEIDPRDYQAALDQALAKLASAKASAEMTPGLIEKSRASVDEAQALLEQDQAKLRSDEAELARAKSDLAYYQSARNSGVVSNTEWQKIQTEVATRQAAVNASQKVVLVDQSKITGAKALLSAAQSKLASDAASIKEAQTAVDAAQLKLSYTKVYAAQDGRVTKKSVEPGDYIAPGQALFALVSPDYWITANFKETQLTRMHPGQPVDIRVDAYPSLKFKGHVDSIQSGSGARFSLLPPENATGNYVKVVQRVPVKIVFDQLPDAKITLGPGMSAEPEVDLK